MSKYNGIQGVINADGVVIPLPEGTSVTIWNDQEKEIMERRNARRLSTDKKAEYYKESEKWRGEFFVTVCNKQQQELLYKDVTEPTVNKLMYLATFMRSDNCLCNDEGKPLDKAAISNLLLVRRITFSAFWKECIEKNLITGDDKNGYYLPKDKFRYFNNKGLDQKKTALIKVFKHSVRYMYENTDERSKKSLSHLYRLIPYINLKYNVLCTNPFEMDKAKVNRITLADMCELLGVDKSQKHRLLNCLKKLSFIDKQGDERSVITYSWDRYQENERYWIRINPQFYAGYAKESEWIEMIKEFEIGMMEDN